MKYYFFDLDGTLADTDGDIRASWKAALADLDVSCPTFDKDFVAGPPLEEMAKKLLPDVYTDELGVKIRERFGYHYDNDGFPNTFEYPGILDAVKALKSSGERVFIATNKRYAGASAMATKFGWDKVFEKLYAGDMYDSDPTIGRMNKTQLLAFAMREIGANQSECIMVGDTINDFTAAKANGIFSIGVKWGYGCEDDLLKADKTISSAKELL